MYILSTFYALIVILYADFFNIYPVTRSRRESVDSPAVGSPRKQTRSAKLKNIDENGEFGFNFMNF